MVFQTTLPLRSSQMKLFIMCHGQAWQNIYITCENYILNVNFITKCMTSDISKLPLSLLVIKLYHKTLRFTGQWWKLNIDWSYIYCWIRLHSPLFFISVFLFWDLTAFFITCCLMGKDRLLSPLSPLNHPGGCSASVFGILLCELHFRQQTVKCKTLLLCILHEFFQHQLITCTWNHWQNIGNWFLGPLSGLLIRKKSFRCTFRSNLFYAKTLDD